MLNDFSIGGALDALVPISRFNKGEANRIFDEVSESGGKIVVKNNVPVCVLITPERYKEMLDIIENQLLVELATKRTSENPATIPYEQVIEELGITQQDVDATEVDFE